MASRVPPRPAPDLRLVSAPRSMRIRRLASEVMMDAVTKYVARHINDGRPIGDDDRSIVKWAEFKAHQKRLERLLEQTAFIADIMTGARS